MSARNDDGEPVELSTLAQFFALPGPRDVSDGGAFDARAKSNVAMKAIAGLPAPMQGYARKSLDVALKSVLDLPFKDIFGKAWNTRRDLMRFCDRAKYPPLDTINYALKETAIDYGFQPSIQLELNGKSVGPVIPFDIEVELLSSPVLMIRDAHVIGARVGAIEGKGSVSCGGTTLIERKTREFRLPGDLSFGNGFVIGRPYGEIAPPVDARRR